MTHTVEKIGGTSMSRVDTLRDTLFIGDREGDDLYGRIFVVSAFGGITNLLLEHKKSGEAGVYAQFAHSDTGRGWHEALDRVGEEMVKAHEAILEHPADIERATDFVRGRIEDARNALIDLQRLCTYGHFRLEEHMLQVRVPVPGSAPMPVHTSHCCETSISIVVDLPWKASSRVISRS